MTKIALSYKLFTRYPFVCRSITEFDYTYLQNHHKLGFALQVIATAEMRRRLAGDSRVFVCALDPGEAITSVTRTIPGWADYIYRVVLKSVLLTPEQGNAQYCIRLATW